MLILSNRKIKQIFVILCDVLSCWAAVWFAIYLLLDARAYLGMLHVWLFMVGVAIFIPIFLAMGFYRAIFRYTGLQSIAELFKAFVIYTIIYALVLFIFPVDLIPSNIAFLQPIIFAFFVISSRVGARYYFYYKTNLLSRVSISVNVIIYGAGSAGRQLCNSLSSTIEYKVVGYVDDNYQMQGGYINGLPIFGFDQLPALIELKQVQYVFLAIPSLPRRLRGSLLSKLQSLKVKVKVVPSVLDLIDDKVSVSSLREIQVEDILGRSQVEWNFSIVDIEKKIKGKVVMVTGAGGSIGSEISRQIVKARASVLILVDISEFALYKLELELKALSLNNSSMQLVTNLVPMLANVRDAERMSEIFRSYNPTLVYHAAAYKHVPLLEQNPVEGLKNNIYGTLVTLSQSILNGVTDFVLVSTDKAVRPSSIMGASKRVAEMVLQANAALQLQQGGKTRLSMVRFGNVLESSGSVVPLFRDQIAKGGPLTVTDKRVTRYFMMIPEAAHLVLHASTMAAGGEVFLLDMGEPVRIFDLAKLMVELSGLTICDESNTQGDIYIHFTGLRPGEKLYEELLIGNNPIRTNHPSIMKANEDFLNWDDLKIKLDALENALNLNEILLIHELLKDLVAGYQPDFFLINNK